MFARHFDSIFIVRVEANLLQIICRRRCGRRVIKLAFHDADTDTARIFADTSDTRDFLKLFLWQAETTRRHSRDDRREDVGVGVVECGLYCTSDGCMGRERTRVCGVGPICHSLRDTTRTGLVRLDHIDSSDNCTDS